MGKTAYHFDHWAEFLTVTLAENISRCHLGQSPVNKIRIQISPRYYRPAGYKVTLANGIVASHPTNKTLSEDGTVNSIEYFYNSPCSLPKTTSETDTTAAAFIAQAKNWDQDFYADAWSLDGDSIPSLLRQIAFRTIVHMLPIQLKHQGVDLTENCEVLFYDGENYLSFFYDGLYQSLKQQVTYYLRNEQVFNAALSTCLYRDENKRWFKALCE